PWEASRLPWSHSALRSSLELALQRRGIEGRVESGPFATTFHVRRMVPKDLRASLVVMVHQDASGTSGVATSLRRCVNSIRRSSGDLLAEIIVAVPFGIGAELERVCTWLDSQVGVKVLWDRPHEGEVGDTLEPDWSQVFVAAHAAACQAVGEYLCFVHSDVTFDQGSLYAMAEQACVEEIGVVGARLVTPQGEISHSGIIVAPSGPRWASGALDGQLPSSLRWAGLIHDASAVSSAALMTRASIYHGVGGFDPDQGGSADVDYCLKVTSRFSKQVVVTPLAEIVHYGTPTESLADDPTGQAAFANRWTDWVDPYLPRALDPKDGTLSTVKSPEQYL
ncbi:MAG TPA: hypothetical protein VMU77_04030, partial [Acidimicrobiales bacterium]|nr:hypothetical protein [Acidimicrobiales bacterium]